ncbi:glycine betaine ABC transporter substrate-binding protein [Acidovorax sp. SRB_14]|uniref:glycine betaine/L-proline ABC transporter substrate-binding protein ProX n=1 Tax=unclassified Acidovorax TaxID=2684926 RepID=UPI00145D0186|nr:MULTISPECIES: glycine betaine/L-proline ABC transporter substrate-binding protein ProX [unclassified Acidovorax]NMM77415.1 glycine betaine ABC transporter substrate-binding protein [Acidovorax sp. SRB_24]NMM82079.1 glycine betaine ABC transporter substrate-binding protein [Acidovorax sp. SRB_14]
MNISRALARTILSTGLLAWGLAAPAAAADLPGKGITVQPIKSSVAEELFQSLLVSRALEKLGYTVKPAQEIEYATGHLSLANGDATFLANHWDPLHVAFFENAGGDAKIWRNSTYVNNSLQGYLIDKKTADQYKITNLSQLSDPKIAALFDTNGDGKADLTGCNPGWGCELAIEHHLDAYQLRGSITHNQGSYAALMADTMARYKQGKPILYYTWTPYWISNVLRPGKEAVFLQVPFSAQVGNPSKTSTKMADGRDYGFIVNVQRIVASKAFTDKNPAAAKLFELMKLPVADINAQNQRMNSGENKQKDVERHVDGWIKAHQKTFDGWVAQALAAAK